MYKKTIEYEDFNGNKCKEDFYFNLTKAELTELQFGVYGGYDKVLQKIIDTKDQVEMIKIFKEVIKSSYGIKSEDGRRFVKRPEYLEEFMSTNAYSELFMELATNDKAASDFTNGIMPQDLRQNLPNGVPPMNK